MNSYLKHKKTIIWMAIPVIIGMSIFLYLSTFSNPKKTLRVMTYSSFASVFGPGNIIKTKFEKNCMCRIKWIKIPDSTLFIQRLKLKKDGFKTDVVLGLDQLSLPATQQIKWETLSIQNKIKKHIGKSLLNKQLLSKTSLSTDFLITNKEKFIPYDWSPMTFLSRKKLPLMGLKDLLNKKYKNNISLPSPQTSTVGLQFYYWIWFIFQEKTVSFITQFKKQLYGLPPSWSTSYSLFQRGHVDLSFSYFSSLLYHQQQKQNDFYPIEFKEGYPFQIELSGVPSFCTQCQLAQQFVNFLLTPAIQEVLFQKNYMLPILPLKNRKSFLQNFSHLKLISYNQLDNFLKQKTTWYKQ